MCVARGRWCEERARTEVRGEKDRRRIPDRHCLNQRSDGKQFSGKNQKKKGVARRKLHLFSSEWQNGGMRRDGETENPGWTARRGVGMGTFGFCTFLHCPAWRQRATTTWALAHILSLKWTWESSKTTAQELVPKETSKRSWTGRWRGDISRSISPSAKRTGTNLVRHGRRLACETAARWVVGGWAQLAPRKKDATPVWRLFLAGPRPRPPIDHPPRVMMRGGNKWVSASCACLLRMAWHAQEEEQLAERVGKTPRAPPSKPRLHVENPGQQRHGMGRRGVQCERCDGISPPACLEPRVW